MEFPTIVYRVPGPYKAPGGKGKTYDYKGVNNEEEYNELLSKGWFETIGHAQESEDLIPTRAEIEQKAKELGLKFNAKISDENLMLMISSKLAGE